MPITSTHECYKDALGQWHRCRTAVMGSDAVKAAGAEYLPRLGGQDNDEYAAYKLRALYYNAAARTVAGYLGAIYRKPSKTTVPARMTEWLEAITPEGVPLSVFEQMLVVEVIQQGRYGVMIDPPDLEADDARPYLAGYVAESIHNWRIDKRPDGQRVVSMVVLEERAVEGGDRYEPKYVTQYRELSLDEEGRYRVDIWREDKTLTGGNRWAIVDSFEPTVRGERLTFIPFVFFGPTALSPVIERSPILDLVDVNLSHYRSSADLEHGRHWSALPTPWVAGFPETTKLKIGSATAWVASDPAARAGMLEFTGQGLGALEHALEEKQAMMASLGARLIEEQKRAAEAADTVRLRQAGESSVIRQITQTCSRGLTRALRIMALWSGASNVDSIEHQINLDHFDARLDAQALQAMVMAWQAGAVSYRTLFWNLQQGEVIPADADEDTERQLIQMQAPMGAIGMMPLEG